MQTDPVLYSFRRCPYAMRARMALAISATTCELREIKLSAKPAAMLAASPKGTVPVMVLPNGQVIDESLDIMRWALAHHDPEGWLLREDKNLIAANDGDFKRNLDRYKYPHRHESDALQHRQDGMVFLNALNTRLAETHYLSGQARGLTDAAIMPFVRQFSAVDPDWFEAQPLPFLKSWLTNFLNGDLFRIIMLRIDAWSPKSPKVLFPSK